MGWPGCRSSRQKWLCGQASRHSWEPQIPGRLRSISEGGPRVPTSAFSHSLQSSGGTSSPEGHLSSATCRVPPWVKSLSPSASNLWTLKCYHLGMHCPLTCTFGELREGFLDRQYVCVWVYTDVEKSLKIYSSVVNMGYLGPEAMRQLMSEMQRILGSQPLAFSASSVGTKLRAPKHVVQMPGREKINALLVWWL